MSRIAVLFFALCTVLCTVFAVPVENSNLEKRVTHSGRGTWFDVGLGACGYNNVNSDHIVAISHDIYDGGANCNQWMEVTNTANGKSVYVQTRDECMGCEATAIDLSPSAFQELASLDDGVLTVDWHFMSKDWSP